MLGLIAVGALVVRARVWPKPARYLPLAANLLLPVDIALMAAGTSEWTQIVVRSLYLAATYALLGFAIMRQVAPAATTTPASSGLDHAASAS